MEAPQEDAVASWYENLYTPLVDLIRKGDILDKFPGRTEADLYIWILEQQAYLKQFYGDDVSMEDAIRRLMGQKSVGGKV